MRDGKLAARATESAAEASPRIGPPAPPGAAAGPVAPDPVATGAATAFARAVDGLEAQVDPIAAAALDAIRAGAPSWISASQPGWARLEERLGESLRAELASFRAGMLPGALPAADAGLLDLAVEVGDLEALLAGQRLAQTALWVRWFELTDRAVATATARRELRERGSRFFPRYSELLGHYLADAYRRRMDRRSGSVRSGGFGSLPAEGDPFTDAHLDFDLAQHHLGAIAWGEPPERAVHELAARLDRVARVRARGAAWWVCLSGREELSARRLGTLRGFVPAPGVRLAIGLEGFGEAGLHGSFRQALRARSLAVRGAAVTHFGDVAVEALALSAEADTRAFVSQELRGIDDDSPSSEALRATLEAYLATGLNAASAAARLGVHHQTVANRLRAIESRLGHPLISRTLELALALRLRRQSRPDRSS